MAERDERYDVLVIGGGVCGPADVKLLTGYTTGVMSVALVEKEAGVAQVQSGHEGNSQTLHFGDIETNMGRDKVLRVQDAAELVAAYLELRPDQGIFERTHKMVLAVGSEEVVQLEQRFADIRDLFPLNRLIYRDEIEVLEPNVVKERDPGVPIAAIVSPDGYIVNYGELAQAFVRDARSSDKTFDTYYRTTVKRIVRDEDGYSVETDRGMLFAKVVVVTAGGHSLMFAKQLGYGEELEILPVAGSFYRTRIRNCVNGKVYTMQIDGIPFAAPHADPEVKNLNETRFGPTAKPIPFLERHRYGTFFSFLKTIRWNPQGFLAFFLVLMDWTIAKFAIRSVFLDLPIIGKWMFLRDVRKIIPSIRYRDLEYARGVGGVRPQIINTKTGKMLFGEGKIIGDGIIFSITPSPGASVCLRAAEEDVAKVVEMLGEGYIFDQDRFRREHTRVISAPPSEMRVMT